ncbi:LOW QUALITY PROTEIN: hypothetical protein TorRG33x02_159270 [Trema orientale]|uniref:Uncharacterized protein n=1 Tax=Trema orientale TaxID=63057 RepID=A0A2P5ES10_TREOI|nr:LOW QUALITY PROTEIN: hypothetical protein TorRG33x02_159270 [Trema orientale]
MFDAYNGSTWCPMAPVYIFTFYHIQKASDKVVKPLVTKILDHNGSSYEEKNWRRKFLSQMSGIHTSSPAITSIADSSS